VHTFFESKYFLEELAPLDGAAASLKRLSTKFRMVVVTSRQHCIAEATIQWLERHFPKKFEKVYFGNHWARDCPNPEKMNSSKRTKLQMCQEAGAIALIDDSASYAKECGPSLQKVNPHRALLKYQLVSHSLCVPITLLLQVVLFGAYGWNALSAADEAALAPSVQRVAGWEAATDALMRM
jgi:hypothetical protein